MKKVRGHRHKKGRVAVTVVRREAEDPSGRTRKERRGGGSEELQRARKREEEREKERHGRREVPRREGCASG